MGKIIIFFILGLVAGLFSGQRYIADILEPELVLGENVVVEPTSLPSPQPSATPSETPMPTDEPLNLEMPTLVPSPTPIAPTQTTKPSPTVKPTVLPTLTTKPTPTVIPTATPIVPTPTTLMTATNTPTLIPTLQPLVKAPDFMEPMFAEYAQKYKVDVNLLKKIANCESHFNTGVVSSNGLYAGMFQFAAGTWITNRNLIPADPNLNLRFGALESIETAAFMISRGDAYAWPNCAN